MSRWVERYLPLGLTLDMEKAEWKSFRNALDKSERKQFDDMWDIPRLYLSACSNSFSCSTPPYHYVDSILHHYKELKECINQVERIREDNSVKSNSQTKIDEGSEVVRRRKKKRRATAEQSSSNNNTNTTKTAQNHQKATQSNQFLIIAHCIILVIVRKRQQPKQPDFY